MSPSSAIRQTGLSASRSVVRTSFTASPSASLMLATSAATAPWSASGSSFFLASSSGEASPVLIDFRSAPPG